MEDKPRFHYTPENVILIIEDTKRCLLEELILSLQMEIKPESDPDFQIGIRTAQGILKTRLRKLK